MLLRVLFTSYDSCIALREKDIGSQEMGGSVWTWKELEEALRDEGSDKEQWEYMQWFEQASKFDLTGCGDGERYLGPNA